jgi:hypothetical protein
LITINYSAHPEEELKTIISVVKTSPLLLRMIETANNFVIRYPISYLNFDQMESWAEFEERVERLKAGSD